MWNRLAEDLRRRTDHEICEFERYRKRVHDENARRTRRSTDAPEAATVYRPATWGLDPGFDPFHVRKRQASIAHAVTLALRGGTYSPQRPAGFHVPKADGGQRLVSTFPIVDEIVSGRLYRSLLEKNRPRLSARSYAYRSDLGPHDALAHVQSELSREQRVFVAEYDFSKFFDRISHDHLWATIEDLDLVMTRMERRLLGEFLRSPEPYVDVSCKALPAVARRVGVPQGTSISLLLANIAATPLDRDLERLGVGFVRYADDTLIWSRSYAAICDAVQALHEASARIGAPINFEKSEGVRLLVPAATRNTEMTSTTSLDYLGHRIQLRQISMKPAVERRVRGHVEELIYNNLLREPLNGTQDLARLTGTDRDYATFIWQLRRYMYGPLSESQVRRFSQGSIPPMSFEGVMSFFPLVNDHDQLRNLDEWVATRTWLAVRKRSTLLASYSAMAPAPWGRSRGDLFKLVVKSSSTGREVDLRLPSFRRASMVIASAVRMYGVAVVGNGRGLYLYEA